MFAYESLTTKETSSSVTPKVVAVAFRYNLNSNGVSLRWLQLELVAYENGRKESLDHEHCYKSTLSLSSKLL